MNNISGFAGAGHAAVAAQEDKSSAGPADLEQLADEFSATVKQETDKEKLHKAMHKSILTTGLRMTWEAAAEARKSFDG
jgi:hypothetical protein